jgi:hypothetical protein
MRDKMNQRLHTLLDECESKRRSSPADDGFDGEAQFGLTMERRLSPELRPFPGRPPA